MCVECEDTDARVKCVECDDVYCDLCFVAQHRKGSRKSHKTNILVKVSNEEPKKLTNQTAPKQSSEVLPPPIPVVDTITKTVEKEEIKMDSECELDADKVSGSDTDTDSESDKLANRKSKVLLNRSKFIPLRLSERERELFTLLDASLSVSEYTDKVDILSYRTSLSKRIITELKEIFNIISGMVVASDFRAGKRLVEGKIYEQNEDFFQEVFEIGRRYKIMNPEKMRNNYGKMIYLLQDSSMKEVRKYLKFSCVSPLKTVYDFLDRHDALDILLDENIEAATAVISSGVGKMGNQATLSLADQVKRKKDALEYICGRYTSDTLSESDIELCLSSINDNNSYLSQNCGPISRMIDFLQLYFHPEKPESSKFKLDIRAGKNGARISHSHSKQYQYALQSLLLWKNITTEMFQFWCAVEEDLLGGNPYRLRDTGQGLNRMQRASNTSRLSHSILNNTQRNSVSVGQSWVGSSVIHLGDHNVPNALMFIDKYTQVSRILSPIVNTIDEIDSMAANSNTSKYINNSFGDSETLKKIILCDFFKHGFDGSGAENFFDAGSCIDGRLTSAWNWCSKIEKKSFYHVFLIAGFVGFDGHFEK